MKIIVMKRNLLQLMNLLKKDLRSYSIITTNNNSYPSSWSLTLNQELFLSKKNLKKRLLTMVRELKRRSRLRRLQNIKLFPMVSKSMINTIYLRNIIMNMLLNQMMIMLFSISCKLSKIFQLRCTILLRTLIFPSL